MMLYPLAPYLIPYVNYINPNNNLVPLLFVNRVEVNGCDGTTY